MPGGRAIVGGFLVAAAAVGVFAAYLQATSGPEQSWVVATADVTAGQPLSADQLGLVALDLPPDLADRAFSDPDHVVGAVATAPLGRFDLVLVTHLVDGSAVGYEQMSFPIERARAVAGTLQAGDRIDVLASYRGSDETAVVASDLLVLDVDAGEGGITGRGEIVVTVALTPGSQARDLAHAVNNAALQLVRTTSRQAGAQTP